MHVNHMNSELSAGGNMMRLGGMGHNDSLNSSFDSRKPGAYGGGHDGGASAYGGNSQLRMSGKIPPQTPPHQSHHMPTHLMMSGGSLASAAQDPPNSHMSRQMAPVSHPVTPSS